MLCKAVKTLSEGVKGGNGDEYAKDVSRLANFTTRSAISIEMRETMESIFDGSRETYVKPTESLSSLVDKWDLVSAFIREGGAARNKLFIDDLQYDMDDLRDLITLINVDGQVFSGAGDVVVFSNKRNDTKTKKDDTSLVDDIEKESVLMTFGSKLRACLRCKNGEAFEQFWDCEDCPVLKVNADLARGVEFTTSSSGRILVKDLPSAKRLQNGIFVPGCYTLAVSQSAFSEDFQPVH